MTESAKPDRGDNGYGWVMVGVGFGLVSLAFGGIGSIGVFLKPLAADFGWSRGEVSLGYSAIALSAAAFGIFWGWLADRRGGRGIALFGVIMMGLSYFGLSFTGELWYYYLMHFAFGALGNSAAGTPIFATTGFWFTRNQGLAIGVMAAGGAFGKSGAPATRSTPSAPCVSFRITRSRLSTLLPSFTSAPRSGGSSTPGGVQRKARPTQSISPRRARSGSSGSKPMATPYIFGSSTSETRPVDVGELYANVRSDWSAL